MKKLISQSSSDRKSRLKRIAHSSPDLLGELIDASICNDIAFELYHLRKHSGYSQEQLAELAKVKQSNISRWEAPGYQGYKVKVLSKLVRLMGGRLKVEIEPFRSTVDIPMQYSFYHERKNYPIFSYVQCSSVVMSNAQRHVQDFNHNESNKYATI